MEIGSKNRRKQLEWTYIISRWKQFNRPTETVKHILTVLTDRWKNHKETDKNHFIG
jgi:hypothetical protein